MTELEPALSARAASRRRAYPTGASPRRALRLQDVHAYWPLAALIALALVVRFATLDEQSLWYDEAVTATRVLHPSLSATLSAVVHGENTPPLYYVLIWFWTRALGTGVFALRSLSALAGVATVGVAWAIGRELATRRVAIVLAAIVATNPLFVWYSQEARAYELFVLFAAVAFLYFLRARAAPTRTNLALWATASALALLTHYFALPLVAIEGALLFARRPRDRGQLIALALVAGTTLALFPLVHAQGGRGTGWISSTPLTSRLETIGRYYLLGESGRPLGVAVLLATLAPIAAALPLARRLLPGERTLALLCLGVGGGALLAPLVLALAGVDYLAPRYLVGAWVPLSAALALVLAAGRTGVGALLAVLVCVGNLAVVAAVDTRPQLQRGDWLGVVRALKGGPSDRAIVIAVIGAVPLQYYLPHLQQVPAAGAVRVRELDLVGYAPLRRRALRPPAAGFALVTRSTSHGLVVLRYRAAQPTIFSLRRLLRDRPTRSDTRVLAPAAAELPRA